jgi:hypothetical protein
MIILVFLLTTELGSNLWEYGNLKLKKRTKERGAMGGIIPADGKLGGELLYLPLLLQR